MESAAANEDVEIEEQLKQILAEGSKSFNMATMFLPSTIRHSARPPSASAARTRRLHIVAAPPVGGKAGAPKPTAQVTKRADYIRARKPGQSATGTGT
jgi:hypothetical protein